MEMEKIVICGSCGAQFDGDLAKCPYCGSTNLKGSEKEYMEKLEGVKEDMGELDEVPMEELKGAFQKQGKRLKKVLLSLLALAVILLLVVFLAGRGEKKDYKDQYLWEQENFPKLDQLYDAGEYDEMLAYVNQLMDDGEHDIFEWEHCDFYLAYDSAARVQELIEKREAKDLSGFEQLDLFYCEWYLVCLDEFAEEKAEFLQEKYSEQEMAVLAPRIGTARQDLMESWGLSEQDYDEFLDFAAQNYYRVPLTRCEEYIKDWTKGVKPE